MARGRTMPPIGESKMKKDQTQKRSVPTPPKSLNDVLYDVQFGDNVGLVTFGRETYVAIDDKNLYYDVSSEEKMKQHGIQIVSEIIG